jgi:TPR repeat protein
MSNNESVAGGVFKGLFMFFIGLPIIVLFGLFVLAIMVRGCEQVENARSAEEINREATDRSERERSAKLRADDEYRAREAARVAYEASPEGVAERLKQEEARRSRERELAAQEALEKARAEEQRMRPIRERAARIAAYQLQQASNGYPSFQIEVAKRYMAGDGLPIDKELARHWLNSACTNGESQATNLLKELRRAMGASTAAN